jgi:hypothetical protein
LSNGFIAMLFTERYVAGRSMNSLVTGLARHGAEISPATLAGACAQAGALLAPVAKAITARSRDSWHLHADETTWRVFAPRDGDGPAKWSLWVSAPRGALSYPSRSEEELRGTFVGPMAYLEPKGEGDSSMPENQRPCPGVWGGALGGPRDMAKAGLPAPQFPEGENGPPVGKTPETDAGPAVERRPGRRILSDAGAMPSEGIEGDEWGA